MGIFFGQAQTLRRLGALTDGVYAIVITLLVLDLNVPKTPGLTEAQLLVDLWKQVPNFMAYIISFCMVALFWMRNHWILKPLKECDEKTFWLNLAHLLFVSLTPYTASLIGHYRHDPIAVILFSSSLGLAGLSLLFLHRYVATKTEWHSTDIIKEWTNPNWLALYPGPLFALCSILLSFININAAVLIWLLTPAWALLMFRR